MKLHGNRKLSQKVIPCNPIFLCTKSDQLNHSWGITQQEWFKAVTHKVVTTHVLTFPNIQKAFKIEVDASRHAMGLVLIQHQRLVAYHSKTFSSVILNYSMYG